MSHARFDEVRYRDQVDRVRGMGVGLRVRMMRGRGSGFASGTGVWRPGRVELIYGEGRAVFFHLGVPIR